MSFRVRFTGYYWSGYITPPSEMDVLPKIGEKVYPHAGHETEVENVVIGRKLSQLCPCCEQEVSKPIPNAIEEWVIYCCQPMDTSHISSYHRQYHND